MTRGTARSARLGARIRGPWRVVVEEASMQPAVEPGDWLLIDPTVRRWPRRGSIVLFHEPETEELALKRVAGGPGDVVPFSDGFLHLAEDEAWVLSDASDEGAEAAGFGAPIDSRRFGPVSIDRLVGRAWFRYGPPGRPIGRLAAARADAALSDAAPSEVAPTTSRGDDPAGVAAAELPSAPPAQEA